jgi:alpha-D-ribose 1-methylphosphonate 5-triphosphate synthase subunit PhnH
MSVRFAAGFADPVHDSQRCFRAVLDAMAHPGRIARAVGVAAPAPLSTAAAAVLLTLADHETPLWLDPDAAAARDWIAFHRGTPIVADPAACAFALSLTVPDLARFPAGTHEEPERSATLICHVAGLDAGTASGAGLHGTRLRLIGPGLRAPAVLAVTGLPPGFAAAWRANHALFPRGVDLILCADDRLTALPRSVSIEEV